MPSQNHTYTIGVDIGTHSARVCVVDDEGFLVAIESQPSQTWRSQPGCYEQSTSSIWRSICESMKNALASAGVKGESISAIVFDATCSLAVFDTESNHSISVTSPIGSGHDDDHNVVLWMHHAASSEAELISATQDPLLRYLGGSVSPFMALAKVLWLKNSMNNDRFQGCRFLDLQDAMTFIATGEYRIQCDDDDCRLPKSRGFGIDGTIKGWNEQFLRDVGLQSLTENDFERVGGVCKHGHSPAIGTPVGRLCAKAASELGLSTNVVVGTGVIDCYAGWVGTIGTPTLQTVPGTDTLPTERIAIVAGTSACHILASDQRQFARGLWGPYHNFLLPASYAIAGGQNAVGRLLQHVIETHPAYHEAQSEAKSRDQTIFDFLNDRLQFMQRNEHAPNITYLGRHVFFYGDHFGNRTPIADANMTGSIIGLTGDTDINNLAIMYYSAMEFLALQTHHIITTMTESGHTIRSIFMSGSVCQNPVFTQLLATVCDKPVVIPMYSNASVCYGSALLAAYTHRLSLTHDDLNPQGDDDDENGSGGLWSVMTKLSRPGHVVTPDEEDRYARALLDTKYTIFLEQADRQRVFRRMIDDVPRN